ncbi:hypothetical protein W97_04283 [Coniosporium apollinis CBS 100218]|uniref:Kinesin-like protein n=1 Tax=Coniosporium apollinis (strain CBS 100218) TaxID=1168221 RepID=R7YT85_CONA1|nr:uncharacterized protein W97_04283 [Coniosporium apollinis CBS 100218]EON65048.1 hypothetical protein W97_04283 [Coniosporium apollinis CBS 100218]
MGRTSGHTTSPLSLSATPEDAPEGQRSARSSRSSIGSTTRDSTGRRSSSNRTKVAGPGIPLRSPLPSSRLPDWPLEANNGLLNPPSPRSRNSSAHGSYASATTFEDIGEEIFIADAVSGGIPATDRQSAQKDGNGNVIVSVRVRPDAGGNEGGKTEVEWMVDGRKSLVSYRGREGGEYIYDNVFTAHDNNAKVYDSAAKRLVRRVMEGYHGTVFAYGMTGTGKTFSMQGTATSPGVIPLAITDIFSFIRESPHREFLLRVSYLEIYNEKIHDLLAGPPMAGQTQEEVKLREDSKRGVYATPLKEEIVQSPTQLLRVIARGDNARRVSSTQYNARSSRSHAVVQIVVESRDRVPGSGTLHESKRAALAPGGVRVSTLSLIDLAGSERAAENKERRTEGGHINKSLLTLGTVIARLSGDKEKESSGNTADKEKHLPYRDSKLTRLLQPALSGNSLVSILCTVQLGSVGSVASANSHTGETLNTLKFASRAKNNIVSHAKKAEEALPNGADAGSRALLDRYRMEIQELRKQLENQTREQTNARDEEEERARELEAEQRHEEQMLEMQLARTALKERIEHLNRLILSSKSLGVNANRSFGYQPRESLASNNDSHIVSQRSSTASRATLEVPNLNRKSSSSSGDSPPSRPFSNTLGAEPGSEEEDSIGEYGDGTATQAAQIRALQADLADRNRYISTLELRLRQARRSSNSRVTMAFHKPQLHEEGGAEALLKEKDAEIAELRARLDDKDRMVTALRTAARQRDIASPSKEAPALPERRRISAHRSQSSGASETQKKTMSGPLPLLLPEKESAGGDVDVMTRMIDSMMSDNGVLLTRKSSRRTSLRTGSEGR